MKVCLSICCCLFQPATQTASNFCFLYVSIGQHCPLWKLMKSQRPVRFALALICSRCVAAQSRGCSRLTALFPPFSSPGESRCQISIISINGHRDILEITAEELARGEETISSKVIAQVFSKCHQRGITGRATSLDTWR